MCRSKNLLSFIGIAISVGILAYFTAYIDFGKLYSSFTRINLLMLLPLVLCMLLGNVSRALRWQILLPKSAPKSTKSKNYLGIMPLFEGIMVGHAATFVLPLRAGEFARAFYISKIEDVSFSKSFATIVTERVFDVIILLALLEYTLSSVQLPSVMDLAVKSLAILVFAICVVILLCYKYPRFVLMIAYIFSRFLSRRLGLLRLPRKIHKIIKEFILGLQAISSLGELLLVIVYSGFVWFFSCLYYWFAMLAMGNMEGSLFVGTVVSVMVALAVAAPSGPGFIGTYQFGCIIALTAIFHIDEQFSLAYSIITHIIQAVFIILFGFFFLGRRGIRLAQLCNT